jgi:sarcosine oxidase subunit beta
MKVLVLERRAASGQGDNKAAIGGVRATHSDPAKILTCIESLEIFSTWQEKYGFHIGWKEGGYCFPVYTENIEKVLKGILPIQKEYGLVIDWVEPERIAELVPGINRKDLRGGTFSPHDGQISPLLAAVAFQMEAADNGAKYHFNEKVVGYQKNGHRITGVITEKDTYSADTVVLAAGADAGEHSELLGIEIPVKPDSHEAGISAPIEHFLGPLVVDLRPGAEGRTANFYFGQNNEGQIIFCYTPKELFIGKNRESLSEFLPILANRMISLLPRFKNLLIRRVWRGCYPMTPDGIPIIDKPAGLDGLMLVVGMCGRGFMMGPGVAKNVTSMIVDGKSTLPEDVQKTFRYDRDFYASKKEALK